MRPRLGDGYSVEVDSVSAADWCTHVAAFDDGNVYQLWQHEPGRERSADTSRLLLKRGETVVAAAEVRLFRVPATQRGIAYVRWGPLWRRSGEPPDPGVLRHALRALHDEYVVRRKMVLRIMPRLSIEDSPDYSRLLTDEGFSHLNHIKSERTLLMRISGDLEDLRKGLSSTWRRHLNKAERAGLTLTVGTAPDLFDDFIVVYDQMLKRKHFSPWADIHRHRRIQAALPDGLKMVVLLARMDGHLCSGLIYTAIGDTAVYLFGATNETGMQVSASSLLHWETVKRLKGRGVTEYDLNGINPDLNPGLYQFKKGLAGKNGREVTFVGQLQGFQGSLTNHALVWLDRLRHRLRTSRPEPRAQASPPTVSAGASV